MGTALLLLLLAAIGARAQPQMDVVAAVVLFRHGDRTPIEFYPNDPWKDPKYWPDSPGQLTDRGKLQHFELGTWLRIRYEHLLSKNYDPREIFVRSTDVDRTLMSALANLAGLYPTLNSDEFTPGLPWQPVPVHTKPEIQDELLAMKAPCPKFDVEKERLLETDFFKKFNEENLPIYRYLTNQSGKRIMDMTEASYIYDLFLIEELYNYTLPDWTKSVYPDKLKPITQMSFMIDTYTPLLARLKIGPLFGEITDNLIHAAKGDGTHNVWVYSAHDTTIASLLNGLNLRKFTTPPYAAHILFELLQDNSIRIIYQTEVLEIPDCGGTCPLYQWMSIYAHLFPQNHTKECFEKTPEIFVTDSSPVIYMLVAIIILLILVNVFIFIFMRRWFLPRLSK